MKIMEDEKAMMKQKSPMPSQHSFHQPTPAKTHEMDIKSDASVPMGPRSGYTQPHQSMPMKGSMDKMKRSFAGGMGELGTAMQEQNNKFTDQFEKLIAMAQQNEVEKAKTAKDIRDLKDMI